MCRLGRNGFAGLEIEQIAQGFFKRVAAVLQGNQVVAGGKQRLVGLGGLAGVHFAVAVFGFGNAGDFLILLHRFFAKRHCFVEIGDIEISIGHVINQREARAGQILLGGLISPHLRIGLRTELLP